LDPNDAIPRAWGSTLYLYFNYSESGSLRWYVKVSRKGRRIGIAEEYGTPAFDAAHEAAVAALGGVLRMRRVKADVKPDQPDRHYLYVDVSQRSQTRYYVQLRNKLPKIRIKAELGTAEFDAEVDAAIAAQIALYGNEGDYQRTEARTPSQAGNLLSALRGMIRWMIDEGHLDEDDDPTIGFEVWQG
jgi:hypothetical protein